MKGITALLMQNFKNGCAVVARNFICRLCNIKVVMFQLIIKAPTDKPTKKALSALTLPRYSGASINVSAPYGFKKWPLIVAKRMAQNNSKTW